MSAVRMVAYGVLELKPTPIRAFWDNTQQEEEKLAHFENDQLRKLVNDELQRYGLLLLKRTIVPKDQGWYTGMAEHVLLGQLIKGGFTARAELCLGTFKECCIKAAEVLDAMDRAQELGT